MQEQVNEKTMVNENRVEMGYVYNINKNGINGFQLAVKFDKFKFGVKAQGIEKEVDAATAASSIYPSERVFSAFNNASLLILIDSLGNVKSVLGYQKINDQMSQLAKGDASALQIVNSAVKQYVNEGFFKQMAEQSFKIYPNKILRVGDEWTQNVPISSDIKSNTVNTYKLKSVKNGIATISYRADIDLDEQPLTMQGYSFLASLKGEQFGECEIEINSGMLIKSESDLKINGKLQIMGSEVPVEIKTKNVTSRRSNSVALKATP
jgi:hypothetical protein